MFFFFFVLFSWLVFYIAGRLRPVDRSALLFVYAVVWVLFVGGQYDVGTDYFSYINKFQQLWGLEVAFSGDYLFIGLIEALRHIGFGPQSLFFCCAAFNIVMLLFILKHSTQPRDYWIFMLLYLCNDLAPAKLLLKKDGVIQVLIAGK